MATATERAREFKARYARMSPEEKCVAAGEILYRQTYARVVMPERVDALLECVMCRKRPSQTPNNGDRCETSPDSDQKPCKPKTMVCRMDQIPPWVVDPEGLGGVRTWTSMGGRGSGKSFTATSWFVPEALKRLETRWGVLGPDFGVSVRVGILGPAGFKTRIERFDPALIYKWDEVKSILTLVNGSRIFALTTENPKSIEGPEYHGYWVDELAELRGQGGDNCIWRKRAEPGIRLVGDNGEPIRKIMTGTPDATVLIKDLWDSTKKYPKRYAWTTLKSKDNMANIDADQVRQQYEEATDPRTGKLTRYGRAKLEGELILESEKALLNAEEITRIQVDTSDPEETRHRTPAEMDVVKVYVDANHSDNKKSDECGIIVMGRRKRRDDARIAHVFADASTPGGPKTWGERIIEVLIAYPEIDEVGVEDDKSLVIDVVERVLRDELQRIGRPIKVKPISTRNKSKKVRADPVAVEYQLAHILHDPDERAFERGWLLGDLEWQWQSWDPTASGPKAKSPDRVDADVHGATDLLLEGRRKDSWHSPRG